MLKRLIVTCVLALGASPLWGADTPPATSPWWRGLDVASEWQQKFAEWWRRQPQPIPENAADQKLVAEVQSPVWQHIYVRLPNGQGVQVRFLAMRLKLTNLTRQAVTIDPKQIELDVDGTTFKNGDFERTVDNVALVVDDRQVTIGQLRPTTLQVAPGFSAESWVAFSGLPRGPQVPAMKLKINGIAQPIEVDLNARFQDQLQLLVERLGPRGMLALVTIGGELNALSYPALHETLSQLVLQKVQRAVIVWSPTAKPIAPPWLWDFLTAVESAGRDDVQNQNLQSFPSSLVELRLAELPAANRVVLQPNRLGAGSVIHDTMIDALIAALRSAYEVVPREELLESIRSGGTTGRCAALVAGSHRLGADDLPLLRGLFHEQEELLRRAAVHALRQFGDQTAIDELLRLARSEDATLSAAALDSLAASRFGKAHAALLDLLESASPALRAAIISAMARHPRPEWSNALYAGLRESPADFGGIALRALVRIGHPQLLDLLHDSLQSTDESIRSAAYLELASRTDPRSEAAALSFALEYISKSPPTPEMLTFLGRVKPAAAIPLLLKHLDQPAADRSLLITQLTQIGDQQIADSLADRYSNLRPSEQALVLGVLGLYRSPRFLEFAASALQSDDQALMTTACQWLQFHPSAEGTRMLVAELGRADKPVKLAIVANTLGALASPEAIQALRLARAASNHETRSTLLVALKQTLVRSPGYNSLQQAEFMRQSNNAGEAIKYFTQAIKADPQLADAYLGRANLLIQQNKYAEAGKDLEEAIKLDDLHSEIVTGLAITKVVGGQWREGLKLVEDSRAKFPHDELFAYNAACAYGRCVETALKDAKFPDREQSLTDFRRRALDDLQRALKLGFDQFDWMKKDPDLQSLHDLPEFQKLGPPAE